MSFYGLLAISELRKCNGQFIRKKHLSPWWQMWANIYLQSVNYWDSKIRRSLISLVHQNCDTVKSRYYQKINGGFSTNNNRVILNYKLPLSIILLYSQGPNLDFVQIGNLIESKNGMCFPPAPPQLICLSTIIASFDLLWDCIYYWATF